MFKFEKIVDQHLNVFGFEVLSKNANKIDWSTLSVAELNSVTLMQLDCLFSKKTNIKNFFINLERRQIRNRLFLDELSKRSHELSIKGIDIIFELTERSSLSWDVKSWDISEIKISHGLRFAIDDLVSNDKRWPEVELGLYDFIKIDSIDEYLKMKCKINTTLKLNENSKIIIEKIEDVSTLSKIEHNESTLFQGFLFND